MIKGISVNPLSLAEVENIEGLKIKDNTIFFRNKNETGLLKKKNNREGFVDARMHPMYSGKENIKVNLLHLIVQTKKNFK